MKMPEPSEEQHQALAHIHGWNEAGEVLDGSRLCVGDSGSGMLQYNKPRNAFVVYGVYSLTTGMCGGRGEAAFGTDVRQYLDWIKSTIKSFS